MAEYVRENSLDAIVVDGGFVDTLIGKEPEMFDDDYLAVVEILVDRFHDRFILSSSQRKMVNKSRVDRSNSIA